MMIYTRKYNACVFSVRVIIEKMKSANRVQILDDAVYTSLCANTRGKGMNQCVIPDICKS